MFEDKARWNKKYQEKPMLTQVSSILSKYMSLAQVSKNSKALDIACGTGRNTIYMADAGFCVDALDISDYALSQMPEHVNILKQEVDLDTYSLEQNTYGLIVNCNYLNRHLMHQMKDALVEGGLVLFETFIVAHDTALQGSMNASYLLKKNELLEVFEDLEIISYEEKEGYNLRGEKNLVASLVARK